ncbi:transcription termination factor 1, mitochondrial [Rhineura floridana]|uniref:transcription termination factor 1, mitochondrial n=1 Tax=Rhineura floridana TaxID=261503 RepID=UPI002AC8901B|nr:transcription termination factor 1, mitochondrial [Rhineura floridana]XP_061442057.1 transcription termination factor 1, mitochondrial [Rhineura floridana]
MRGLVNMKSTLLLNVNIPWFIKLSTDILFRGVSPRFLCLKTDSSNAELKKENNILVKNLADMGVDVTMARKRQPGVLKRQITNEDGLKKFLLDKGANKETIANIISRYPRAIIRSHQSLQERWEIWRGILMTDKKIVTILQRSPESFFRSGNNANMQKNITLFCSLGLTSEDLGNMLIRVPRVFSSTLELNKQMIGLLNEIYIALGGENPDKFIKRIISKNAFILLRSSKQVKANIQYLQSSFVLSDQELLILLHGEGADVLDLSHEYLKKTLANVKEKLFFHGCTETEVNALVLKYLRILYTSPQKLNDKIDLLLQANININQIMKTPRVLTSRSIESLSSRIAELEKLGYDFGIHGIRILLLSKQCFGAKLEKLQCTL